MSTHYAYTLSGNIKRFELDKWIGASNAYGYSNIPDSSTGEYIISSYTGYQEDPTGQYTLTTNYAGELLTTYFTASELYYHEFVTYSTSGTSGGPGHIDIDAIAYNLVDGNSLPSYLFLTLPTLKIGTKTYRLSTYEYIPYGEWGYNILTKSYGFLQPSICPTTYDIVLTQFNYNEYDHNTGEIFTYKNYYGIRINYQSYINSYNSGYYIKYCPTYPEEVEEGSYIFTLSVKYGNIFLPGQISKQKTKKYYFEYIPKGSKTWYLGIDLIAPSLSDIYWPSGTSTISVYPGSIIVVDPSGDIPYSGVKGDYNNSLPILGISIEGNKSDSEYRYTNDQWQSLHSTTKPSLSDYKINAWHCNNSSLTLTSVKMSINEVDFYVIATNTSTKQKNAIKIDSNNITWSITS